MKFRFRRYVQCPLCSNLSAAASAPLPPGDVIKGIDLSGRVAIVTGGYSGLGLETTRAMCSAGAKVIVPARDYDKAATALEGIDGVEVEAMDLLGPASIDAFAEKFLASGQPLHILVNSAGIMACPLARDARGYESQFVTNRLGHFQLVARLWPALRQAHGARVVSVSSWGHRRSPVVFDDPISSNATMTAGRPMASRRRPTSFSRSSWTSVERRKACAPSLHPGSIVGTGLGKHLSHEDLRAFGVIDEHGKPILDPAKNLKTAEQGAATSVWCATSPQLNGMGGVYCENCDIAPLLPKENEANAMSQFSLALRQAGSTPLGVMPASTSRRTAQSLPSTKRRYGGNMKKKLEAQDRARDRRNQRHWSGDGQALLRRRRARHRDGKESGDARERTSELAWDCRDRVLRLRRRSSNPRPIRPRGQGIQALDILFLNAGILRGGTIAAMSGADFDEVFRVNVKGPWLALKAAIPLIRRGGAIILNASINARLGMPGTSAYAASKAALRSFTRTAASEPPAEQGVRVNAISPGPTDTGIIEKSGYSAEAAEAAQASLKAKIRSQKWERYHGAHGPRVCRERRQGGHRRRCRHARVGGDAGAAGTSKEWPLRRGDPSPHDERASDDHLPALLGCPARRRSWRPASGPPSIRQARPRNN